MRTLVVGVSDTHINSTVGLCRPSVNLDDGGTYKASRTQRAIWDAWLDYWDEMKSIPADRRIVILNGDLGELDTKRRSSQLITLNKATVLNMIVDVLQPALDIADQLIFVRGTEAHVGNSAWLEEAVADDIDISIRNGDNASWDQFRGIIDGVRFDVAHHASMGRLPWTEKTAALKIAKIALDSYMLDMNEKPPDIVWRAHNHRYASSGDNFDNIFAVCMMCWQGPTKYIYRIGQENRMPHIGGVYAVCENGQYQYDKIRYNPRWEKIWSIKI